MLEIQKDNVCTKKVIHGILQPCENGKYAESTGDSVVTCNEIIEKTKVIPMERILMKHVPTENMFQQKVFRQKLFQQKVLRQIFTFY